MPDGWSGDFFAAHARYAPPPPGVPSPQRWGTTGGLADLLGDQARSITNEHRTALQYYRSIEHAVEVFSTYFGPTIRALETVGPEREADLRRDLAEVFTRYNRTADGTAVVENTYLLSVAVRA